VELLMKQVRVGVTRETADRQVPWESSSLKGNFYFVPGEAAVSAEAQRREIEKTISERVAAERDQQEKRMRDTIRQLLAQQRAEFEEELQRRGQALPVSAPAAPVAVAPIAVAAPTVATPGPATPAPVPTVQLASAAPASLLGTGIDNPRFPKIGDRWEYRYTDTTTRRQRKAVYEIRALSTEGIVEAATFGDERSLVRAYSADISLVQGDVWDFSPYMLSFGAPKPGERWSTLVPQRSRTCSEAGTACNFSGRVAGTERISTPAGSFDTVKIVVDFNLRGGPGVFIGATTWREITYWYSEAAKRIVKSSLRTRNGNTVEPDYDLELVSYKLN
jgi:hypothetical protein